MRDIKAVQDNAKNSLEMVGTNHLRKIIIIRTTATRPNAELLCIGIVHDWAGKIPTKAIKNAMRI